MPARAWGFKSPLAHESTFDNETVTVSNFRFLCTYDLESVEEVQAALSVWRDDLEVIELASHDWMEDEFAGTTWQIHRPGQFTRDLKALQQPQGVLHFATTDNANLWGGFIDGAIESGLRTARNIKAGS